MEDREDQGDGDANAARLSFIVVSILGLALAVGCSLPRERSGGQAEGSPSYLNHVAWPSSFYVEFTNYVEGAARPGSNYVMYEATSPAPGVTNFSFKSFFTFGPNLPGVPHHFVGQPCEYYLYRDPQSNDVYHAYVYCVAESVMQYSVIASNLGGHWQDFVARYHQRLPAPPLATPLPASPVPVTPTSPKQQWFITYGSKYATNMLEKQATNIGYYACLAEPTHTSLGDFKAPFSFTGRGAGVSNKWYGQLLYNPASFMVGTNFPAGAFQRPTAGFTEYTNVIPTTFSGPAKKAMNCSVCHASDNGPMTLFTAQSASWENINCWQGQLPR